MATAVLPAVERWHECYVMTGGAAAALGGQLFTTMGLRSDWASAAVAAAHGLLIMVYHVLRDQKPFVDLGPNYFEPRALTPCLFSALDSAELARATTIVRPPRLSQHLRHSVLCRAGLLISDRIATRHVRPAARRPRG